MNKKIIFSSIILCLTLTGCFNKNTQNTSEPTIATNSAPTQLASSTEKINTKTQAMVKTSSSTEPAIDEKANEQAATENFSGTSSTKTCNSVNDNSICIEYIGSIWTDDQMKSSCKNLGKLSNDPCPSNVAGGCKIGAGTKGEMVNWFYLGGKAQVTVDSLKVSERVCKLNPKGKWITK